VGAQLGPNRYGKAGIHVATVVRREGRHDFFDRVVNVRLEGDFETVHTQGLNETVLPTDTMRGSVYALSKERPDEAIEAFALRYTQYLLDASPAATSVQAWVAERPWDRIEIDGEPHPHAFTRGAYRRTARVLRDRNGAQVFAGVDELSVLKTTGSAFAGFLKDRYTSLGETDDRILATMLVAEWRYAGTELDFVGQRDRIKDAIVRSFAEHDTSNSMQHTLWDMGRAVLDASPNVEEVSFSLPNLHHIEADLTPYGLRSEGEVFVVTDSPSGQIEGTVRRTMEAIDAPPPQR
jgi:urate oxidase